MPESDAIRELVEGMRAQRADLAHVRSLLDSQAAELAGVRGMLESRDTRPMLERVYAEIAELKSEVAELRSEVAELKSDVAGIKSEIAAVRGEVRDLRKFIMGATAEMHHLWSETDDRVRALEERRS